MILRWKIKKFEVDGALSERDQNSETSTFSSNNNKHRWENTSCRNTLEGGQEFGIVGRKLSDKQGQRQWDKLQAVWYLGSGIFSIPILMIEWMEGHFDNRSRDG